VIEHLDPEPLSLYAGSLLGTMKPNICIITTPNRDFNPIFNINFPLQGQAGTEATDSDKFASIFPANLYGREFTDTE